MVSGLLLTDSERKTLAWLAKNFPFAPTKWDKMSDWNAVWSSLVKECGLKDEADVETTVSRLVSHRLFEGGRHSGGMFIGRVTTPGEQYLRRVEQANTAIRAQGPRWKQYLRRIAIDAVTLTYRLVLGLAIGAVLGLIITAAWPSSSAVVNVAGAAVAGGVGAALGGGIGPRRYPF